MIDKSAQIKALYEQNPYPEVLQNTNTQTVPMLIHWINAAVAPTGISLHPRSKILSAGCGSGAEVFILAQQFPEAHITGLDFSTKSIEIAQKKAKDLHGSNVQFDTIDLTDNEWPKRYTGFDFIVCHGVADYVDAPQKMMYNLSNCLSENGVLCMTVNSPAHPAARIQTAYAGLWGGAVSFEESEKHRNSLKIITELMGNTLGIDGIATAHKAYLDVDIFPPFAQHLSALTWLDIAKKAGLEFAGSLDAPIALTQLSDASLDLLYHFDRTAMSRWVLALQQKPGTQLLFCKKKPTSVKFNAAPIESWSPFLSPILGQLPTMDVPPLQSRPLSLSFTGMPDFKLHTRAYDLEVLRRCNGRSSLAEIIEGIGLDIDQKTLWPHLFRAYHYGLIS